MNKIQPILNLCITFLIPTVKQSKGYTIRIFDNIIDHSYTRNIINKLKILRLSNLSYIELKYN